MFANTNANWWEGGQKVKPGEKFQPRKLNTPLDKLARKHAGRRSLTREALAYRERVLAALAPEQPGDDLGVERGAALPHAPDGGRELFELVFVGDGVVAYDEAPRPEYTQDVGPPR